MDVPPIYVKLFALHERPTKHQAAPVAVLVASSRRFVSSGKSKGARRRTPLRLNTCTPEQEHTKGDTKNKKKKQKIKSNQLREGLEKQKQENKRAKSAVRCLHKRRVPGGL